MLRIACTWCPHLQHSRPRSRQSEIARQLQPLPQWDVLADGGWGGRVSHWCFRGAHADDLRRFGAISQRCGQGHWAHASSSVSLLLSLSSIAAAGRTGAGLCAGLGAMLSLRSARSSDSSGSACASLAGRPRTSFRLRLSGTRGSGSASMWGRVALCTTLYVLGAVPTCGHTGTGQRRCGAHLHLDADPIAPLNRGRRPWLRHRIGRVGVSHQ
jgi:hypothetical protein